MTTYYTVSDRFHDVNHYIIPSEIHTCDFDTIIETVRVEKFGSFPSRTNSVRLFPTEEEAIEFAKEFYEAPSNTIADKRKLFYVYGVEVEARCWLTKESLDILSQISSLESRSDEYIKSLAEKFWGSVSSELKEKNVEGFSNNKVKVLVRNKYSIEIDGEIVKQLDGHLQCK